MKTQYTNICTPIYGNTVSTEQCECTGKTPESDILVASGEGERIGPRRRRERILTLFPMFQTTTK